MGDITKKINKFIHRKSINEMMSKIPLDMNSYTSDAEVLRAAIVAEYDATNLYLQMAEIVENENVRRLLIDVAREEKVHIEEFKELLEDIDEDYEEVEDEAEEEIEDKGFEI